MTTQEKLKLTEQIGIKFPHFTNTNNPIDFPKPTEEDLRAAESSDGLAPVVTVS